MVQGGRDENLYLLLDSWSCLVARGHLETPLNAETLQMQVLDQKIERVLTHEVIQIVGMDGSGQPLKCRLLQHRNDRILLEKLEVLDASIRQNLRIPVRLDSLVYPVSGTWKGRRPICTIDLSCGGIAFYTDSGLEIGETVEIVVPTTEQPLLLRGQILRKQELHSDRTFYAVKFVDLCDDEETLVRRTVFSIQIEDGRSYHDEGQE